MKILFLFLILVLMDCGTQISAVRSDNADSNSSLQPSPTVKDTNQVQTTVGKLLPLSTEESAKLKEDKFKEEKIQIEKLKDVPEILKKTDFENFSYPFTFSYNRKKISVPLKNGSYEYDIQGGRGWFEFNDVFFSDLTGDNQKEAVVSLTHVSCGGSCDGGSELFYFYSIQNRKLKLQGLIESGSRAYGCSIKSFKLNNKEITIEQFGRCQKNSSENEDNEIACKFCVKDLTVSTYVLDGGTLKKKVGEIISTPEMNVMNYADETYIIE